MPCGAKNNVMDQIHSSSSQTNLEGRVNENFETEFMFSASITESSKKKASFLGSRLNLELCNATFITSHTNNIRG